MDIEDILSRVIVGAIDPDWRLFQAKIFQSFATEPSGRVFLDWARQNPLKFEAFVRSLSAAAHAAPKDTLFREKVSDFVKQASADLKGMQRHDEVPKMIDDDFRKRFEEAVEPLSEEDLRRVARLSDVDLHRWIDAPVKLRPAILEKFCEPGGLEKLDQFLGDVVNPKLRALADRLEASNKDKGNGENSFGRSRRSRLF